MRRARLTYPSAWHHVMNRGHEGRPIFPTDADKELFVRMLLKTARKYRIRLVAYCVLDNHFHLVLQNTSGKLSEAMKRLESAWGVVYRRTHGGRGYVFQDRFKSTLIEEGDHLRTVIAYVWLNPVRAGLVREAAGYPFSSLRYQLTGGVEGLDTAFVEGLFGSAAAILGFLGSTAEVAPPEPVMTRIGPVLGSERFLRESLERFDRRRTRQDGAPRRRIDEPMREAAEVMAEFQRRHGVAPEEVDPTTERGKRLRGLLLVALKDEAGWTYREISRLDLFKGVKVSSLPQLYRRAKRREKAGPEDAGG